MSVTYIEVREGHPNVVLQHVACFSGIGRGNHHEPIPCPDSVKYLAKVNILLNRQMVEKWVSFVSKLFIDESGESIINGRVVDYKDSDYEKGAKPCTDHDSKNVSLIAIYNVNTKGATRFQGMLYLTACRYVDEFAPIVLEWYNSLSETDTDEQMFEKIQNVHLLYNEGAYNEKGYGLVYGVDQHGMMNPAGRPERAKQGYGCYGALAYGPISIDKLRANVKLKLSSVTSHFTPNPNNRL